MFMTDALTAAMAGGGTKTSVCIAGRLPSASSSSLDVRILARGSDLASNYSDRGLSAAVLSISRAVERALQSLPHRLPGRDWTSSGYGDDGNGTAASAAPFDAIWAGLSGVDSPKDVKVMHEALSRLFGLSESSPRLRVANDCDLLASPIDLYRRSEGGLEGGIVLIAGTGSIATAYKPSSSGLVEPVGRMGGLGFLLGDEGSAFHIGRQTIKAVLTANDRGHFSPTSTSHAHSPVATSTLVPRLFHHFEVSNVESLLGAVYALGGPKNINEHDRKVRIAEVARLVMEAAYASKTATLAECASKPGDPFAVGVLAESARFLSELVKDLAAARGIVPERGVLCLGGGTWGFVAFKETVLGHMCKDWGARWKHVEVVSDADGIAAKAMAGSASH